MEGDEHRRYAEAGGEDAELGRSEAEVDGAIARHHLECAGRRKSSGRVDGDGPAQAVNVWRHFGNLQGANAPVAGMWTTPGIEYPMPGAAGVTLRSHPQRRERTSALRPKQCLASLPAARFRKLSHI